MRAYPLIGILIFVAFLIVGCQEDEIPTPDFVLPSPTNTTVPPTSIQIPTRMPTSTPEAVEATETSEPPTATATLPPTPTPIPLVIIEVLNSEDSQPAVGVSVNLSQEARGYEANFQTLEDGTAQFIGIIPSSVPYVVEINHPGYRPISMEVVVSDGTNTFTFELERGANATINIETVNLRAGAGLEFDIVVEVVQGDSFPIIGVSEDLEWYQLLTPEGLEGWVFADLVDIEGDLSVFGITGLPEAPPAQTPVPGGTITPTATVGGGTALTPTPYVPPVRPPRIQFNPRLLYNDMVEMQDVMVQLRGVLDRREGDTIECQEYIGYYQQIIQVQTYRNVPEDWVKIHNLYVNSATNALDTNRAIYLQCIEGGGPMSAFNFRNARNGIDFSLDRLRLGIIGAEDRIGVPDPAPEATPES